MTGAGAPETMPARPRRTRSVLPGVGLLAAGALALLAQVRGSPSVDLLFLPAVGLVFLTWGVGRRNAAPLLPGGICCGCGLALYLLSGPLGGLTGQEQAGVVLLSLALGWLLVLLCSIAVDRGVLLWSLIPAGLCAAGGAVLLVGGTPLRLLTVASRGWPALLLLLGVYVLTRQR